MQAREEGTRSEALNRVGRWLDRAPAYQPTHLARDAHRHAALTGHRPIEEPQVHTLDIDDALDALTKLRLEHQEIFDEDWPAPFAWHVEFGTISFEERTRRALDRFAEDPDAAVPSHLDALHRYATEWTSSVDGLVVTFVGSVYRSSDRVQVVWIETSRYVNHG